ncbi:MAG: hypothetical protein JXR91_03035 [Deltaproteobacteria bacterium]|nr:hypothetical protein [Deltaproteobacteria bacterium]
MKKIIIVNFLAFIFLTSCGGTQNSSSALPSEEGDASVASEVTSSAQKTKNDKSAAAPKDEQAEAADKFCKNEIEKSKNEPVELLDKKQIKSCIVALRPAIKAECDKGVKKELIMKIVINKDGSVSGAFAIGDGADCEEATCIAEKIKSASFPAFTAKETQVIEKYPFVTGQ